MYSRWWLFQLDLEKALVSAELNTEQSQLDEMEKDMMALQAKIHRLEAQRNANRVLAETQQNKLKQSIDMKQNHIEGWEPFCFVWFWFDLICVSHTFFLYV